MKLGVSAVSFVILIGSGLAWVTFKHFTSSLPHGAAVPALAAGQKDIDGADKDILLVGNDSRAGASPAELLALSTQQDGGSENTDTMMILHVPANGSPPTIVSFPRDSWVDIPGYSPGKMNAAYGDGYITAKDAGASENAAQSAGIIETIKTMEALTGLHIDHYMQVNLLGFYRISNAIGGVTVCLNAAQNANTDSDAFGKGYSGINLPKGVSVIKGTQALAFVRQRHGLPNGDLDRVKRQQYFLASAFRKISSAGVLLNPFKLHNLLTAVGSSVLTDPALNPIKLAGQFETLSSGGIGAQTIPNTGPATIYPGGVETSIVQLDKAAIPGFIQKITGDSTISSVQAAVPGSVTADVLNGSGINGWGTKNADRLKQLGFHVGRVSTDSTSATATQILYPPGDEAGAKALEKVVPGTAALLSSSVSRPTLVLGTDRKRVSGVSTPQALSLAALAAFTQPLAASAGSTAPKPKTTPAPSGLGCIN